MTTYYSEEHEWIALEDGVGTVGITDYAQGQLGDVVFVDLPEVGQNVEKGGDAAVVESVKAASEVYAPVTGEIVGINGALGDTPEMVNAEAESGAWFMKIKLSDTSELDGLMDAAAYKAFCDSL